MPTDIVMPQMGESIVEGTITKWLKKPGDKVQRDEPLFEISTDKVDAEIPAPASGVLQDIKVAEGATVQVNTVVGTISDGDGAAAKPAPPAKKTTMRAPLRWSAKSRASTTSIWRRYREPDWAGASPSRTSPHFWKARLPPTLPPRRFLPPSPMPALQPRWPFPATWCP